MSAGKCYDHGLIYVAKGTTFEFNLHSTAILTDETRIRHALPQGYVCGVQVSLEPNTAFVSTGLFSSENLTLEQTLKVTGHQRQTGDEFATIEWFYSKKPPEPGQFPNVVHRIKFIVLDGAEEEIIESRSGPVAGLTFVPEALGTPNTPEHPEQVYFRLALKLIDSTGTMVQDFETAIRVSERTQRRGRIDWSDITGLRGSLHQISYLQALNIICRRIREQFFNGHITYSHINDLLNAIDDSIIKREEDIGRFSRGSSFNQKTHQHAIEVWRNNRKVIANLLHFIDVQSEMRKSESIIIRDDLAIGITDTDFSTKKPTMKDYMEDAVARLIIPAFLGIVFWFFWSR